ncbi:MAG TPA: transketolase [Planctomycetaceae bacterium]|nr:transketolase [Planctomycetaceae bacterium]
MSVEAPKRSVPELREIAKKLRKDIIRMTTAAGSGHPTSSLSAVEVVAALYFGGFMRYDAQAPHDPHRDRFILSKGHAVPVLYAAMAEAGYFPVEELLTLRKLGGRLEGHPNMRRLPGIEASTGSLGQGLSFGVGEALACRLDKLDSHIYVMMGDGEIEEGQVWEAFAAGHKYQLSNLTAIVDRNGFQQTGSTSHVMDMTSIEDKIAAFGWNTQRVEGNDMQAVVDGLNKARQVKDQPTAIVSHTRKGFGILPLLEKEGDVNYHGKPLSKELAEKALQLIDSSP